MTRQIMKIDYSPLTQKVDDTVIKNFVDADGKKHSVVSKKLILAMALIAIGINLASLLFVLASKSNLDPLKFLYTSIIVVALLVIRKYQIDTYTKLIRLTNFAKANGLEYHKTALYLTHQGIIFNIGSGRMGFDQLIKPKTGDASPFEISNYRFVTGTGDDKNTHYRGYIMIQLDRNVPQIVLDSHQNNTKLFGISLCNIPVSFSKDQILELEGDFNKHFTLFAPKEYKRDALQIFTPDLMASFIDESGSFDAELIDDKLFVYSEVPFNYFDTAKMEKLFKIIETVGARTDIRTEHYADERVGDRQANVVALGGKRLKRRFPWPVVVIVVIAALAQLFVAARFLFEGLI